MSWDNLLWLTAYLSTFSHNSTCYIWKLTEA